MALVHLHVWDHTSAGHWPRSQTRLQSAHLGTRGGTQTQENSRGPPKTLSNSLHIRTTWECASRAWDHRESRGMTSAILSIIHNTLCNFVSTFGWFFLFLFFCASFHILFLFSGEFFGFGFASSVSFSTHHFSSPEVWIINFSQQLL